MPVLEQYGNLIGQNIHCNCVTTILTNGQLDSYWGYTIITKLATLYNQMIATCVTIMLLNWQPHTYLGYSIITQLATPNSTIMLYLPGKVVVTNSTIMFQLIILLVGKRFRNWQHIITGN